ncbi:MAG TPA: OmpA family protein [Thermodesulfobacteriaceae bacterium]|nr:OmpA family protein [Thermodesulfobacteriaceae bacterium]
MKPERINREFSAGSNLGRWRSFNSQPDTEGGDDSLWLITLGDIMSMLLIFCLVWFTMLTGRNNIPVSQVPAGTAVKDLHNSVLEFTPAEVRDEAVVIVLRDSVAFTPGEAGLTASGKATLKRLAPILSRETGYDIEILGHTDNTPVTTGGRWDSNFELSVARAISVSNILVDHGIAPTRLRMQGLGELHPVFPNDTVEHRAANRRVELILRPAHRT